MKEAKYDNVQGIKDMVTTLWSPVKVAYDIYAIWGINHLGPNDKNSMDSQATEEIEVRREDQKLYKFMEGDFLILNLHDIEDMLLLLRVEDLQLGVESYQKKPNITKPETQNRMDLPRDNPLVSVEVLSEDGNPSRANIKQALGRCHKTILASDASIDFQINFLNPIAKKGTFGSLISCCLPVRRSDIKNVTKTLSYVSVVVVVAAVAVAAVAATAAES
nr:hypothetical protein [Tanacetum cinerariifolium]